MRKYIIFFIILFLFITVKAEGIATISNVKVNGVDCKCNGYSCEVEVDKSSVIVTYTLDDAAATVDRKSGFSIDLTSPSTVIKIVVKNSESEEVVENTYSITINKHEVSGDFSLKSLKVNDKEMKLLDEVFVYNYDAKFDEEKIVIKAVANDDRAKVKVDSEYVFELDRSSKAIDFDVVAENGESKSYRVMVNRGEKPDTSLKSLNIDKGNITFDKDTLEYELKVEYSVNELEVDAVANDEKATVKIEKDTLVVGENTIKVIVTNNKAESVYILKVTREENLDKSLANLKSLKIDEYSKLDFEPNVLDYNLKFSSIPESLKINAIAIDPDADIEIVGNKDLSDGDRVVIKVSLKDSTIVREYNLNIIENKCITDNKSVILISIICLIIIIIFMIILEFKDKKKRRKIKLTKIKNLKKLKDRKKKEKKVEEEEIEII